MKGVIFNLLEQFIEGELGEGKYEEILSACDLETQEPFVGPGSYPDENLMAIVGQTVEASGLPAPEALRRFGRFCFPILAEKFPVFLEPHNHPKPFLMSVDSIVHVEVRKLYEGALLPDFTYENPGPDRLVIRYRSARRLCYFMEGLVEGVADVYETPIRYRQNQCMLNGAGACEFDLEFASAGREGR